MDLTETFYNGNDCRRFHFLLEREVVESDGYADAELEFIERHRIGCADCDEFMKAVRSLSAADETPNHADRQMVRGIVELGVSRRNYRQRRFFLTAAAAMILFCVGAALMWYGIFREKMEQDIRFEIIAGQVTSGDREIGKGELLGDSEREIIPAGGVAAIATEGLLFVALEPGAKLEIVESSRSMVELKLNGGRMAVHLAPNSGTKLTVSIPGGEISVKGTVFLVAVQDSSNARISVLEGVVSVLCDKWKEMKPEDVGVGWSLSVADKKRTEEIPQAPELLARVGFSQKDITLSFSEPETTVTQPIENPDLGRQLEERGAANTGFDGGQGPIDRRFGNKPDKRSSSPEKLLQSARSCRLDKDWDCAAENLARLIELYPDRPDATTTLVPLAQILLDHLERPAQALSYFRRYRDKRPGGALGPEALRGECDSLRRLGRKNEERKCLSDFVGRYPENLYAKTALERLDE